MADSIEMPLGCNGSGEYKEPCTGWGKCIITYRENRKWGVRKNCVLDGNAHWRHLADTVEQLCTVAGSGWKCSLFPNYFGQSC